MKKTYLISAFPGTGKTWSYNNLKNKYLMLDSDSSFFSWLYDENKNKTEVRNPEFPQNYIEHIKSNLGKYDFIFISTHKIVRDALRENNLEYILVYPLNTEENKKKYIQNYYNRGNNVSFVENMIENWDNFLDDLFMETYPIHYVLGLDGNGEYVADLLEELKNN